MASESLKKNRHVGLLLTGNYQWVGGLYYVANLLKSLGHLDNKSLPRITVFYNNLTPVEILDDVKTPIAKFVNIDDVSFIKRTFYRIFRILFNRNLMLEHLFEREEVDVIYPMSEYLPDLKRLNDKIIYWIFDFQHKFLPALFSQKEIQKRDLHFGQMSEYGKRIVVSSKDAFGHLCEFYPDAKNKGSVLNFLSLFDSKDLDIEHVKEKYNIDYKYFIISNQFWKHKNHILVIRAFNIIKNQYPDVRLIFTGRKLNKGNENYIKSLDEEILVNGVENEVIFTGFISREDQLALMKLSVAVIQPSLFEGWSTVIEDAKMLDKIILASSLNVNKEQLKEKGIFFDPNDENELSKRMIEAINSEAKSVDYYPDKKDTIQSFANKFLRITQA
jgi:glycosyltransferase involved in cell wall biosynthesis